MRVLVLGGDGYLGWPMAMHLARTGWQVHVVDNYARRTIASEHGLKPLFDNARLDGRCELFRAVTGRSIDYSIFDVSDHAALGALVRDFRPSTIIHFAEQPSAPYSMHSFETARHTLQNNVNTTFGIIWSILRYAPDCHLIKLGSMGEYGTPNIDIEEGWITIEHNGRSDRFLFPRVGGSLYHTTKIMGTDLIHFYVRTCGLRATDLMQGPVYGIMTAETRLSSRLFTNFHYDAVLGTVINRFVVEAVAGVPLTVYGAGQQRRGFLNIVDTMQCIELAARNPPQPGFLRVVNQFTETFSVLELAQRIAAAAQSIGIDAQIAHLHNPRSEMPEHYYNPSSNFLKDHGLVPHMMTTDLLVEMLKIAEHHADRIDLAHIRPEIDWNARSKGEDGTETRRVAF